MKTARYALLLALLTSSFVVAQDNAPVVVPTPTFGNEGAATPPATVAGEQPPVDQPPAAPDAEANKPVEAAIPQTYRDDRYTGTLGKNPFLLKTKTQDQPVSTFAQDWELKFLRESKGTIKAGIQNRQTQQYRNIGPEPDAEGFKIVSAKIGRNRKDSTVEVAKGSETATLTFSDTPAGGGRAPQGGIVPGQQPGQAGVPRTGQAGMPQNYRQPGAPVQSGAAGGVQRAPVNAGGMPVPGQNVNAQQPQHANMPPGNANTAPPNPINRRRVLIPAPAPASSPAP
jgi:hypothetical protein